MYMCIYIYINIYIHLYVLEATRAQFHMGFNLCGLKNIWAQVYMGWSINLLKFIHVTSSLYGLNYVGTIHAHEWVYFFTIKLPWTSVGLIFPVPVIVASFPSILSLSLPHTRVHTLPSPQSDKLCGSFPTALLLSTDKLRWKATMEEIVNTPSGNKPIRLCLNAWGARIWCHRS